MESLGDILKRLQQRNTFAASNYPAELLPAEESEQDRCPICGGRGWVRYDVPVGHADFGKAFPCECQQTSTAEQRQDRLQRFSNMGMLASVINAMALQDALEKVDLKTRVLSAIDIAQVAEHYIRRRAIRHLEKGRIVIFGGGTGNPYFSTDTAAALRAAEIHADVILKATQVDGVYDSDPHVNPDAKRYERITFDQAIRDGLKFMDQAAIALCNENALPIVVFDMGVAGNLTKVMVGETVGTIVTE